MRQKLARTAIVVALLGVAVTAEVLRDGWFSTGDYASRDDDGFFYITGRKKSLIISAGVNIHPEEITEVLSSHPAVLAAIAETG